MFTPSRISRARRSLAGAALLLVFLSACSRKESSSNDAPAATPAASVAAAESVARAPATLPPLTGLDSCLVGKWKASGVTLKAEPVTAEGGANVTLDVASSGASTIDFTPMELIKATGRGFKFDFRYSGKATALLSTPARGTLEGKDASYAGLRVTANVQLPGAGSIPLFKDKPLTELATMGVALAGAAKGLAKGVPSAAAAPGAPGGATPAQGIDSNPVFASNRYTCEGNSLSFRGGERGFEWLFTRAGP